MDFTFSGEIWIFTGEGSWYFVTLPHELADEIQARCAGKTRGFGSIRVQARIGSSIWATSLFRDKKSASYILPLKKEVRLSQKLEAGQCVAVEFSLADF
jgi:hypothetical protein